MQAARDGLVEIVEAHLESPSTNLHDYDEDGFAAIHHAARYNRVKVLEILINFGGGEHPLSLLSSSIIIIIVVVVIVVVFFFFFIIIIVIIQ